MARYAQRPTLEECFEEYTSKDILDNDNKFICSNCSGEGRPLSLIYNSNEYIQETENKEFLIRV